MIKQILLYINTLKYLKIKQIRYRLFYLLRRRIGLAPSVKLIDSNKLRSKTIEKIQFTEMIQGDDYGTIKKAFNFLNITHKFQSDVDWNFSSHGKLWLYNLCYFDYILQKDKDESIHLMEDFAKKYFLIKDGLEPYPSSLRIMNWIKFTSIHHIKNNLFDRVIATDLLRLEKNLEYHLMGNHLLENAFSLLFGAVYFNDFKLLKKGGAILHEQLNEQILSDGGHFELSPMYHQTILSRILDCINLLSNNEIDESQNLLNLLKDKACLMLSWISHITFKNGEIPLLNDSTEKVAPSTNGILKYAERLNLTSTRVNLGESGYRKRVQNNYEMIVDVGNIGPNYIPGHAHSDTLSFVLNHNNKPLIVDTGVSTYEKNELRNSERSTMAHNTVMVNGVEQSEVWGGFRVARRAKCMVLHEDEKSIVAVHDGYKRIGIEHQRSFQFLENEIIIEDGLNKESNAKTYLHFHPEHDIAIEGNRICGAFGYIEVEGFNEMRIAEYSYAHEFNKTKTASLVAIEFKKSIRTQISLK